MEELSSVEKLDVDLPIPSDEFVDGDNQAPLDVVFGSQNSVVIENLPGFENRDKISSSPGSKNPTIVPSFVTGSQNSVVIQNLPGVVHREEHASSPNSLIIQNLPGEQVPDAFASSHKSMNVENQPDEIHSIVLENSLDETHPTAESLPALIRNSVNSAITASPNKGPSSHDSVVSPLQKSSIASPIPSNRMASSEKKHSSILSTSRNSSSPEKRSSTVSPKKTSIISPNSRSSGLGISKYASTHESYKSESSIKSPSHKLSIDVSSPAVGSNIEKIAAMSKVLTNEADALRQSIRTLSEDIARTKQDININRQQGDITNYPYHLFLLELIINRIQMKCECFEMDSSNLLISASFLGKPPIILYDATCGHIEDFSTINVGKSMLFAMTYDTICSLEKFNIAVDITKQPPCTHCVTKIGETHMDYTEDYKTLRKEVCSSWEKEYPDDNIACTASTPLTKNSYYIFCGEAVNPEPIGVIEISGRMSFLGKEVTTTFSTSPNEKTASMVFKDDGGISMYSCQKVEMDDQGKILLEEDVLNKNQDRFANDYSQSQLSTMSPKQARRYQDITKSQTKDDGMSRYDEIFTKMNENELRIRVPKSTRVERSGKYERMQEMCICEDTSYNTGDQIQFGMPTDYHNPDQSHKVYTSNLSYTYKGCDRSCESKDKKVLNITPTNCPVPVNMEKVVDASKDVFILRIGKKLETRDKITDLEIQLVTPKPPKPEIINTAQQYDEIKTLKQVTSGKLKKKSKKDKLKGKVKGGKGIKGKKSKKK